MQQLISTAVAIRERIEEAYSFERRSRLEVFAEDDRDLVEAGGGTDMRIPVRELVFPNPTAGLGDQHLHGCPSK